MGARHLLLQWRVPPLLQRLQTSHAGDRDRSRDKHHTRLLPIQLTNGSIAEWFSNPKQGDDFNALDPTILIDSDQKVWLTYGSYWSGIKQRQIDALSGMLLTSNPTRYDLATRPGIPNNPIEGASLIHHGNYYYLFVSVDYCCEQNNAQNNYKQAVGRSISPHGPFVDENGTRMLNGGGTVLLKGNSTWNAPGGGTAFFDSENDESLIVFHAHNLDKDNTPYQWVKTLKWEQRLAGHRRLDCTMNPRY